MEILKRPFWVSSCDGFVMKIMKLHILWMHVSIQFSYEYIRRLISISKLDIRPDILIGDVNMNTSSESQA